MKNWLKVFINFYLGIFAFLIITMMLLVVAQVIGRYFMATSPLWIEEIVGWILVCVGLMGSAYAFYEKRHMSLTILEHKLPSANARRWLSIFIDIIVIIFAILVQIIGGILFYNQTKDLMSPGSTFKLGILHILLPISGILTVLLLLHSIYTNLNNKEIEKSC